MSKFGRPVTGMNKSTNRAGGESFVLTPIEKLVQIVTTNLFKEPKYYGDVQKEMDESVMAVAKTEPEFILKLAAYCRNELYLRTVSVYLLVKAANIPACKPFVRKYTPYILRRADEINEAITCQIDLFGPEASDGAHGKVHLNKKFPNSLKKGIKESFPNFDEYQFAKYNRKQTVKFKDAIMLTHPKEPAVIIKKILSDELAVPYTWETEISKVGQVKYASPEEKAAAMKKAWEELIDSKKLPYMAMIRNINNFEKNLVSPDHWEKVMGLISNEKAVINSKQFPFRFYSVLKNVNVTDPFKQKSLKKALNDALNISVANLPKLTGRTMIACDLSGSMESKLSDKGTMTYKEVGCLMGAMADKFSDNAIASGFGDSFKVAGSLTGDILTDAQKIHGMNVGCSTNGYLVAEYLVKNKVMINRLLMFTDCELWDSNSWDGDGSLQENFNKYLSQVNPKAKLYVINLNGYGESPVNTKSPNVVSVSGWSEKILSFISTYELGAAKFIEQINSYKPSLSKSQKSPIDE